MQGMHWLLKKYQGVTMVRTGPTTPLRKSLYRQIHIDEGFLLFSVGVFTIQKCLQMIQEVKLCCNHQIFFIQPIFIVVSTVTGINKFNGHFTSMAGTILQLFHRTDIAFSQEITQSKQFYKSKKSRVFTMSFKSKKFSICNNEVVVLRQTNECSFCPMLFSSSLAAETEGNPQVV